MLFRSDGRAATPFLHQIDPLTDYDGNIQLIWDPVPNADNYSLYRDDNPINDVSGLTPIITDAITTYNDLGLSLGNHYYAVTATNESGESYCSTSRMVTVSSEPLSQPPNAPTITQPSFFETSSSAIHIVWSASNGADNYTLFRHTNPITEINTTISLLITTPGLFFDDILSSYNDYFYAVIATNETGNSTLSANKWIRYHNVLIAPWLNTISPPISTTGLIELTWGAIPDADNYTIYRHTESFLTLGNGEIAVDTVTGSNYVDGPLPNGTYYYAVVSRNESGVSAIQNCQSVEVEIPPPVDPPAEWTVPQLFTIELDGVVSQPIRVNRVDIRWLDDIVPNAENLTFYIATTRFTQGELESGTIPSFVVMVTLDAALFEGLSPGDINRYQFAGLENGTYFVCVSYANPLGEAFSNVLDFTVELPPEDKPNDNAPATESPFSVDGFPPLMISLCAFIAIALLNRRRRQTP